VTTNEAVTRAYRDLHGEVRRFVARRVPADLVDDLTQDVFLRMHEHAAELRDITLLAPWLFRVARNAIVDSHRQARPTEPFEDVVADATNGAAENLNEEVATWIEPMLSVLPEEYREALRLTELEGLSQKDLAERLGISASGARSRVQRGRQMLEEVLRACCTFELDPRGNISACAVRDDDAGERARKKLVR
jgi:RNA polymerase sigma-70 factor (ECF subfamily)